MNIYYIEYLEDFEEQDENIENEHLTYDQIHERSCNGCNYCLMAGY